MSYYGYEMEADQYDDWDYNSDDWLGPRPPGLNGLFWEPPGSLVEKPSFMENIVDIIAIPIVLLALCFLVVGSLVADHIQEILGLVVLVAFFGLATWGLYKNGLANLM